MTCVKIHHRIHRLGIHLAGFAVKDFVHTEHQVPLYREGGGEFPSILRKPIMTTTYEPHTFHFFCSH